MSLKILSFRGKVVWLTVLLLAMFATKARAAPIAIGGGITVDCNMTDGSTCRKTDDRPLTWAITEGINDTTTELGIILRFNVPFRGERADRNILHPTDATGRPCPTDRNPPADCVSDQISFFNSTETGKGVVIFNSDPNPNIVDVLLPVGCRETSPIGSCAFSFVMTTQNNVDVGFRVRSAGEESAGSESDSISIRVIPEPHTAVLFESGLFGIGLLLALRRQLG